MVIGLGPGDFVLDGNSAAPLPKKGAEHPQFAAHVYIYIWLNYLMNEDASWYAGRPQPR